MKFKIKTFNHADMRQAAIELAGASLRSFTPDLLIGVRSGGYVIAELMMEAMPHEAALLPITCRRPSTQAKKESGMKKVLARLPRWFNDQLRLAEHILLTQMKTPRPGIFIPDAPELSAIEVALQNRNNAKILIVDDSVDSGATLLAVVETIRSMVDPAAIIKTASITTTTTSPLIQPDVTLYRYVLCRFPWALDFKN